MNANRRKYLVCAPAAHYTKNILSLNYKNTPKLQILKNLFAAICVHKKPG